MTPSTLTICSALGAHQGNHLLLHARVACGELGGPLALEGSLGDHPSHWCHHQAAGYFGLFCCHLVDAERGPVQLAAVKCVFLVGESPSYWTIIQLYHDFCQITCWHCMGCLNCTNDCTYGVAIMRPCLSCWGANIPRRSCVMQIDSADI